MFKYPSTLYELATGRIVSTSLFQSPIEQDAMKTIFEGMSSVDEAAPGNFSDYYVVGGEITERSLLPITLSKPFLIADGKDELVLSGFPAGCVLTVDGEVVELEGSDLTLMSEVGAVYRFACTAWPYRDWAIEIAAEEPA